MSSGRPATTTSPGGRSVRTSTPSSRSSTASAAAARCTLAGEAHPLAPRTLFLIAPAHSHGLVAATAVKTLDIKFRVREARLRRQLLHMPAVWRRADKGLAHLLERIRHEGELRQP